MLTNQRNTVQQAKEIWEFEKKVDEYLENDKKSLRKMGEFRDFKSSYLLVYILRSKSFH